MTNWTWSRYPIYKIPVISSIKRVDASFLTYHSLSADSRSCFSLSFLVSDNFKYASSEVPNNCTWFGIALYVTGKKQPKFSSRKVRDDDGSLNISLPIFSLAAYKLIGSMLAPSRDSEWQKVDSLLEVATDWLQNLQANHPDYLYFVSHRTM